MLFYDCFILHYSGVVSVWYYICISDVTSHLGCFLLSLFVYLHGNLPVKPGPSRLCVYLINGNWLDEQSTNTKLSIIIENENVLN